MKDTKPGKPVSTGIVDNAGIHMSGHPTKPVNSGIIDNVGINMSGHILIRDIHTKQEHVNMRG